jgi:hypothetical protein
MGENGEADIRPVQWSACVAKLLSP